MEKILFIQFILSEFLSCTKPGNINSKAWAMILKRLLRGSQKDRVRAGDLLRYWTVVELGMPMVDLARKFDITPAVVSYTVQGGEKMAKERGYQLET